MLNPTLKFLRLRLPVVVTALNVACIVTKHLDVTIVARLQFLLELLNGRRVLSKKFSTAKEVTTLSVVLVTFNAIEHKKGEHLIFEETSVLIMQQMPSPFLWTTLTSLDVIQISDASGEEPRIRIAEYRLSGVILAKCVVFQTSQVH